MPSGLDEADAERRAILDHCNDEIVALLKEAAADGVDFREAVVLVADSRDDLGKKVVDACAEVGQPVSGADVYVVGVHVSLGKEILRRVAPQHLEDLDSVPPMGAAHLLCFAAGGVRSTFVSERPIGQA
jgi:hypothetical protein